MTTHRAFCLVVFLVLTPGCVKGCGTPAGSSGENADVAEIPVATVREAAPPHERTNRPVRHGGFVGLMLRAGREAQLSPEQKNATADIQQKLRDEEPALTALTDYQSDLVTEIRGGKLDAERLAGDYVAIDKGLVARQDKQADAINALHSALDKEGRSAVAGAARARLAAMFRPRPEPVLEAGVPEGGAEAPWVKHRLGRVKVELGLEDPQVPKVTALLVKVAVPPASTEALKSVIRAHAEDMLTAFEQDTFDAHKLDLSSTGGKGSPHASLERETNFVGQLLPILTPEQREKLATMRQRRVLGRWTADTEPWSPFDEAMEQPGGGPR